MKAFVHNIQVLKTKLKKVPKGYDGENSISEFLKHKSWFLEYSMEDEEILNATKFIKKAGSLFQLMKPFNDYLNIALKDFVMPLR